MSSISQEDLDDWPVRWFSYERHRPEETLLYQIVEEHWPLFQQHLEQQGKSLPGYVKQEFEDFLACGRLDRGFLRIQCEACHAERLVAFSCKRRGFCGSCGARRMADSAAHLVERVFPVRPVRQWVLTVPYQLRFLFATEPQVIIKVLAIVHRVITTWLIRRAGLTVKSGAQAGAVTLIQHFGSALNAHLHFHMLYVDGVFDRHGGFYPLREPSTDDLDAITHQIARRVSRYLEKTGYLVRDAESAYLDLQADEDDAMTTIVGASISYRLAFGPNAGRKALTLQTLPTSDREDQRSLVSKQSDGGPQVSHCMPGCRAKRSNGKSSSGSVVTSHALQSQSNDSQSPATAILSMLSSHLTMMARPISSEGGPASPLEFIGRLAALVPKPRVNLTRFHGVFSPNSRLRKKVVPSVPTRVKPPGKPLGYGQTWAQRLKRVFAIEIEKCAKCGGKMKVIACIEDADVIEKILKHVGLDESSTTHNRSPPNQTPADLFPLN